MSSHPITDTQHNAHDPPACYSSIFRAVFDPNDHGIDPLTATQRMIFEERRRMREGRNGDDDRYSRRGQRQRGGYMVGTLHSVKEVQSAEYIASLPTTEPWQVASRRAENKPPTSSDEEQNDGTLSAPTNTATNTSSVGPCSDLLSRLKRVFEGEGGLPGVRST